MNRSDRGQRLLIVAGVLLLLAVAAYLIDDAGRQPHRMAATRPADAPEIAVYFSPRGGCTDALVSLIVSAKRRVRVQAYSFTSRPIADALIAAHRRGVAVEIVLDRGQHGSPVGMSNECAAAGIPVAYDAAHAIAHNKLTIVDDRIVAGGSFNMTASAEARNAENLTVIRDARTAATFDRQWAEHRQHSER
jgi:phosphatidylserine/phosphatidylglycerophosphate/cardiolipin synthase-like enzyme